MSDATSQTSSPALPDEPVNASAPTDDGSPDLATGDETATLRDASRLTGDETSEHQPASAAVGAATASGASVTAAGAGLPAPVNQPPMPGEDRGDDVRVQASDGGAPDAFAEKEGLTGDGAAPRRDLGEFEDDETVLAAAEPAETTPAEPYRDPHEYAPTAASGSSFGSLLGAGLLGGLIAAALGAGLLYAGLLPVARQQAADQYASAGEVQEVRGEVQSLNERVEQIQSAQAAGGATTDIVSASEFAALSDRVAVAERATQTNASGGAGTAASIAEIQTSAQAATAAAEAATQAAQAAGEQAGSAEAAAGQASQDIDTVREEIAGFGTRLDAIEAANRQAALAFAAAGLKSAIDRGGPFMPELESFAAASSDEAVVEPLRDFAASGVPTLAELVGDWPPVEAEMLAAIRAPTAGNDVGAQVLSGLSSLVTVRPSEGAPASDEGAEAIVSRLRAALDSGDLAAWQSEFEQLPEAARAAGEVFAADVAARRQAMQVVDDALAGASAAATAPQEG